MSSSRYLIREATESDAKGIAFVHVNSWKTSYAGIIDQSFLDTISYDQRLASWTKILQSKNTQQFVALFDEQIVDFAGFGPIHSESRINHPLLKDKNVNIGEVYAIYLLEEYKRKGLGKVFFNKCRLWFDQHEVNSFITWVLADNHRAIHFYKSEGGEVIEEMVITIGDKKYQETCYVFTTQTS